MGNGSVDRDDEIEVGYEGGRIRKVFDAGGNIDEWHRKTCELFDTAAEIKVVERDAFYRRERAVVVERRDASQLVRARQIPAPGESHTLSGTVSQSGAPILCQNRFCLDVGDRAWQIIESYPKQTAQT